MSKELIYIDHARYYDLFYSFKNYETEADKVHGIIQRYKQSKGNDLLDIGCGTAKHLQALKKHYHCTGTDYNNEMLEIAQKANPEATFIQADMRRLKLDKQFDAIISLFSAIGYVKTLGGLKKTIQGMAKHLKPGGVLVIEPWISKTNFKPGNTI